MTIVNYVVEQPGRAVAIALALAWVAALSYTYGVRKAKRKQPSNCSTHDRMFGVWGVVVQAMAVGLGTMVAVAAIIVPAIVLSSWLYGRLLDMRVADAPAAIGSTALCIFSSIAGCIAMATVLVNGVGSMMKQRKQPAPQATSSAKPERPTEAVVDADETVAAGSSPSWM